MTEDRTTAIEQCAAWITLRPGLRISREWLITNAPDLYAAWREAPTLEKRRRLADQIYAVATQLESEPDGVA